MDKPVKGGRDKCQGKQKKPETRSKSNKNNKARANKPPATAGTSATRRPVTSSTSSSVTTSGSSKLQQVFRGDEPGCSLCFPFKRCETNTRMHCFRRHVLEEQVAKTAVQRERKRRQGIEEEVMRKRLRPGTINSGQEITPSATFPNETSLTLTRVVCETCGDSMTVLSQQEGRGPECSKCKRKQLAKNMSILACENSRIELLRNELIEARVKQAMRGILNNRNNIVFASVSTLNQTSSSRSLGTAPVVAGPVAIDVIKSETTSSSDDEDCVMVSSSQNHFVVMSESGESSDSDCYIVEKPKKSIKVEDILNASTSGETSDEEETVPPVNVREKVVITKDQPPQEDHQSTPHDRHAEQVEGHALLNDLIVGQNTPAIDGLIVGQNAPAANSLIVGQNAPTANGLIVGQNNATANGVVLAGQNGLGVRQNTPTANGVILVGQNTPFVIGLGLGHNTATANRVGARQNTVVANGVGVDTALAEDQENHSKQRAENAAAWRGSPEMRDDWRVQRRDPAARNLYMLDHDLFYDCTIILRNAPNIQTEFRCHKAILAAASQTFQDLLTGLKAEKVLVLPHTRPTAFKHLLKFIYGGVFEVSDMKDVLALTDLAREYQLYQLIDRCSRLILASVTPANVCLLLQYAQDNNIQQLSNSALNMWCLRTAEVIKSQDFLSCSPEVLTQMLAQPLLNLDSEAMLIRAYEIWLTSRPASDADSTLEQRFPGREHLRFLALTNTQFAEGPAKSNILLSMEEKLAIFMALGSPSCPTELPNKLSNVRTARDKPF